MSCSKHTAHEGLPTRRLSRQDHLRLAGQRLHTAQSECSAKVGDFWGIQPQSIRNPMKINIFLGKFPFEKHQQHHFGDLFPSMSHISPHFPMGFDSSPAWRTGTSSALPAARKRHPFHPLRGHRLFRGPRAPPGSEGRVLGDQPAIWFNIWFTINSTLAICQLLTVKL